MQIIYNLVSFLAIEIAGEYIEEDIAYIIDMKATTTMTNQKKASNLKEELCKLTPGEMEGKYGKYITLYDKQQETLLLKICHDSFFLEVRRALDRFIWKGKFTMIYWPNRILNGQLCSRISLI